MAGRRASVFAEDIDVSDFQPAAPAKGEQRDRVKAVAEPAAFHSRDPAPTPPRREPRRHRTGRNVQLNLKVRQEDADAFYALADQHGWVLGEAFQKAIEALQRGS
jgi:hypothetical protein